MVLPYDEKVVQNFFSLLFKDKKWDIVRISCTQDFLPRVKKYIADYGFKIVEHVAQQMPFVSLQGTWQEYQEILGKKLKKNLRWSLNKMKKSGHFEYGKVRTQEECDNILNLFFQLHKGRWESKGQESKYFSKQKQKHQNVLKSLARALLKEKRLFLPYLMLDNNVIALAVCCLDKGKMYYHSPTFNMDYSKLSPGKILLYYIIKEAFNLGCYEVDLGPGLDDYKLYWTDRKREIAQLVISRGDWRIWFRYYGNPRFRAMVKGYLPFAHHLVKRFSRCFK